MKPYEKERLVGRGAGSFEAGLVKDGFRPEEGYDAYVGRVARGFGVSSVGQGVGRLLGYATHVAVAWMHGPAQLGFYALGITLVQATNILSQLGLDNGVVRYVAHHGVGGDTAKIRGTIVQSLAVTFALSVALSAGLFLGAGFLAENLFGKPFLETMIRAFAGAIPFVTIMSMALWATQGFGTVKYASFVGQVLRPLANLALVVLFYLLGVQILGAVAAYVLSMALGAALALYCLRRVFPGLLRGRPEYESRELSAVSAPMIVANVTQYANLWIAVAVLGVFEPVLVVGIYNVAARTAALSALILVAFGGVFSPLASSLYRQQRYGELGRLYDEVSRWSFTGALVFFLVTALLARDIMKVFGEEFVPGWPVIVLIAAAQLFNSSVGPTARLLAMTGHQKVVMVATAGSAAAALALSLLLVPRFGIVGAAAATATALVLANVATLFFVRRRLGYWPYGRQYVKPLVAGLAAAAATFAIRPALPGWEGLPALLVFTPLVLTVFFVVLCSLGLSPGDRRFLASFREVVRRTLRRGLTE